MKIYTKTGDKGMTSLFTGQRVPKDSPRVESYGTVDEVESALGLARALCKNPDVQQAIYDVQKLLWSVMAELASIGSENWRIGAEQVVKLEQTIDKFDSQLPPLTNFIVSGDDVGAAALNIARTTARKAERQVWNLSRQESVNEQLLIALNRISDLCFILSRVECEK